MKRYVLEAVVFACGGAVMVFELTGSRVLAPYLGTSIFVWASLIGVILGSLSLGYWWGGIVADRRPTQRTLASCILGAAVLIAVTGAIKTALLRFLFFHVVDQRWCSLIASLVLFAPAGVLLGMVSPYAARLRIRALDASGRTVGRLYAISTVGSIAGTFLAGFVLIPRLGCTWILLSLAGVLVATSLLLTARARLVAPASALILIGVLRLVTGHSGPLEFETQYNSVMIGDIIDEATSRPIRVLSLNSQSSSAIFLDGHDLVYPYTRFYNLADYFCPYMHSALMIGGAAYVYPRAFLERHPKASMDVVEIDPRVTDLARRYFGLTDQPRLNIQHADGRTFLNQTNRRYSAFFGDAFQSRFSVPFQLTTRETAQRVFDLLEPGGVALLNAISSVDGPQGRFVRALYTTWGSVFPQVYLFPVDRAADGNLVQNVMIIALKSKLVPSFQSEDPEISGFLRHRWAGPIAKDMAILTDDRAPVEYYLGSAALSR